MSPPWLGYQLGIICVTNEHGYILLFCNSHVLIHDLPSAFSKSNTTGATSGAGTAHLSGAPEFTPGFLWCSCYSIFSFLCRVLQIIFCHLILFSFNHCIVFPSSIYGFYLSMWYLQTFSFLLIRNKNVNKISTTLICSLEKQEFYILINTSINMTIYQLHV